MAATQHHRSDPGPPRLPSAEARAFVERADRLAALRTIPGRTTELLEHGGLRLVHKRIARDAPRDAWHDRLRGRRRTPAEREHDNLDGLRDAGIRVPTPVGWYAEPDGASGVLMEFVPHGATLRTRLDAAGATERRALLVELAETAARLHRAGWFHRDLYVEHFVLPDDGRGWTLLDVGRARKSQAPRRRWFVKDLAAIEHSLPTSVGPDERRAVLERWRADSGRAGGWSGARWRRAIARRAARMAAHVPRHVDLETPDLPPRLPATP